MKRLLIALSAVVLLAALGFPLMRSMLIRSMHPGERRQPPAATISVTEALRVTAEGYARATEPRPFAFPADHGAHPEFRTEWWYYTGNLATAEGRRFGFQLTFFRSALAPEMPERGSAWATRQAWLAHFAVSDVDGGFHSFERWSRGALGLAGVQTAP